MRYLWDNGQHSLLFTGDFIWIDHGEWKAVVLDPGPRADYLEGPAVVRELDFDVLVPRGPPKGGPSVALVDRAEIWARIEAIITRVDSGANR